MTIDNPPSNGEPLDSRFSYLLRILLDVAQERPADEAGVRKTVNDSVHDLAKERGHTPENFAESFNKRQIGVDRDQFYRLVLAALEGDADALEKQIRQHYPRQVAKNNGEQRLQTALKALAVETLAPLQRSRTLEEVRASVHAYVAALQNQEPDVLRTLRDADFWVHDPTSDEFAPSKFAAYAGMTARAYAHHKRVQSSGFDGTQAREHLSRLVDGEFVPDAALLSKLRAFVSGLVAGDPSSSRNWDGVRFLPLPADASIAPPDELFASFWSALNGSGFHFDRESAGAFFASVIAKPFVILTGLAGSGKTQLAKRFGQWLGGERLLVVPVRPDWTGPEPLLGYEDALRPGLPGNPGRPWAVPDVLEFMLRAAASAASSNPEPFVLVLDEMNLAHVERYFADILSGLESGDGILPDLERVEGLWLPASNRRLPWPRNLAVIGTVNVDETTYVFSPKVLDRAFTLEFRVSTADLPKTLTLALPRPVLPATQNQVTSLVRLLLGGVEQLPVHPDGDGLVDELRDLHARLARHQAEFGFRTWNESVRIASVLAAIERAPLHRVLDVILLEKVLPRLHGARRKLEPLLLSLGGFCAETRVDQAEPGGLKAPRLPRSAEKLTRLVDLLRKNQFASFAEA